MPRSPVVLPALLSFCVLMAAGDALPATATGGAATSAVPNSSAAPAAAANPAATTAKPAQARPAGTPETDALVKAADELRRKGDLAAALKKVQEALRKLPNHPQGLLLAGTLEGALGRLDDALRDLAAAVKVMPDNLFARKVYASALLQKGNSARALEVLEPNLKATTVDPQAQVLAAQISAVAADYDGARHYLEKAFKADPNYVPAHQLAVRIALTQKKTDEARTQLQTVVRLQPDDVDALLALAAIDAGSDRRAEAADWLDKARKARPDAPEPLVASAGFALRQGKTEEAASYLPKLEKLIPGQAVLLSLKGQVALERGHPKDAVEPLEAAFAKQATPEVLVQLHQALQLSGQAALADQRLNGWLDAHPDDLRMRFYAAQSAVRQKNFAVAAGHFRKILEKQPDNLLVLNELARTLAAQKDPQAVEFAERAWKLKPDSPVTENTLGGLLMATGKPERGVGLLKEAAGHAPENPAVRFDYARALASTGAKAQARAELEALLALKRPFPDEAAARDLLKSLGGG